MQSVLVGKAQEIYGSLSVEQSSNYEHVKEAILKAYELVPEAYRQKFRNYLKYDSKTHVEFAMEKENLFNRWCHFKEVVQDFEKLKQMVLLEAFKDMVQPDSSVLQHFFWPGLKRDVAKWCKECHTFQLGDKPNQNIPQAFTPCTSFC